MNIQTKAIVSNSDMIKNYKDCREKAEKYGKIFILKNNQPDAVLFSLNEYEKFSFFLEYLQNLDIEDMEMFINSLPKQEKKRIYSIEHVNNLML